MKASNLAQLEIEFAEKFELMANLQAEINKLSSDEDLTQDNMLEAFAYNEMCINIIYMNAIKCKELNKQIKDIYFNILSLKHGEEIPDQVREQSFFEARRNAMRLLIGAVA